MVPTDEAVFKALADASRRTLLDRLFERDGQTLGELVAVLPQMTRIGVMKHLRILESAGLVVSHRSGRHRLHYLNPVPIRLIHERWLDKFRAGSADLLISLQSYVEDIDMTTDPAQAERPSLVSQIYIRATPDRVWRAITESEDTLRYYYGSTVDSTWQPGAPIHYRIDGTDAIVGTVIEVDPPRRLVHTFDARWDDEVAPDPPSRLTWELEEAGPGVTKVTTVHHGFATRTKTLEQAAGGMPFILSALKTLVETDAPLMPAEAAAASPA